MPPAHLVVGTTGQAPLLANCPWRWAFRGSIQFSCQRLRSETCMRAELAWAGLAVELECCDSHAIRMESALLRPVSMTNPDGPIFPRQSVSLRCPFELSQIENGAPPRGLLIPAFAVSCFEAELILGRIRTRNSSKVAPFCVATFPFQHSCAGGHLSG